MEKESKNQKKNQFFPICDFHLRFSALELAVPGAGSQEQHHAAQAPGGLASESLVAQVGLLAVWFPRML